MKKIYFSIMMIFFVASLFLYSDINRKLSPCLTEIDCENGRTGWILEEDMNGDGIYDISTKLDCDGKYYWTIWGDDIWVPVCNESITPHDSIVSNPLIKMNDLSTTDLNHVEIICYDSITNLEFYKVTLIDTTFSIEIYYNNIPVQPSSLKLNHKFNKTTIAAAMRDEVRNNTNVYFSELTKDKVNPKLTKIDVYDNISKSKKYTIEFTDNPITKKTYLFSRSVQKVALLNQENVKIINIYPNPAKDNIHFTIDSKQNAIADIKIIDLKGNMVGISKKVQLIQGENSVTYDLENTLSNGNYFLHTSINGNVLNTPFVISK